MPTGLPVSTTMTITGGLIGLGVLEGFRGLNYRALLKVWESSVAGGLEGTLF